MKVFDRPYRFFLLAAALAFLLCMLPTGAREPNLEGAPLAQGELPGMMEPPAQGVPAGADLSERTEAGCLLHQTLVYAPCGHSVQRRDALDARLVGLTRTALEQEIGGVFPGAAVTGFGAREVDVAMSLSIPCPLHWVLKTGEDGMLHIYQNRDGETLAHVRSTEIPISRAGEEERAALYEGRIFDDVQSLEGVLESMSS